MQEEQITFSLPDGQTYLAPAPESQPSVYEPSPDNPPWNIFGAVATWIASVVFLVLIGNVGVLIYALSKNVSQEEFAGLLEDPTVILIAIASVIPAHIVTLIFCWFVVTGTGRFPVSKTLGFKWGRFHIGYCILAVVVFYALFGTLSYFIGDEDNQLMKILRSSRAAVYVVAFLATFTAPIVEETVYRGVIYSAFQRTLGVPFAILITSFLFASVHFMQYSTSVVAIVMICLLSLGLTLIRVRSGNILPCIVTHMIFNAIQAAILIAQPYLESPEAAPEPVVSGLIRLMG